MKAFACPQCGASLEAEEPGGATLRCHYCNSMVIVPAELRPPPPPTLAPPPTGVSSFGSEPSKSTLPIAVTIVALIAVVSLVAVIMASRSTRKEQTRGVIPTYTPRVAATPRPTPDPGYRVAFTFGAEGTGTGHFKDEMSVAGDGDGNIYVADETLRVQKFDAAGNFQNTWTIPPQTKWYSKIKGWPQKLLANRAGQVYAVVAGVVMKFDGSTGEVLGAAHGSDYIHDAALIPDGGLLVVSQKGRDDELVLIDSGGRAARRTHRFVSSLLDKQLTVEALRVATDGLGNAYALYALGGVYGEHWYDDEDLAVFKFTPEGKYVNRFGGGGHEPGQFGVPSAIAVDNRSRVYVCEPFNKIHIYSDDGRHVSTFEAPHAVKSMTFDAENNLFIAGGHKVSKLVLTR